MTATISGDGTSTLINLTTSGNTILGDASTDTLNVGNGGLVKDASGNVGIGTASPSYKLQVAGRISYSGAIGEGADTTLSSSSTSIRLAESATWQTIQLFTNGTERARIDSSGNLLVGTTTMQSNPGGAGVNAIFNSGIVVGGGGGGVRSAWTSDRINFSTSQFYVLNASNSGVVLTNGSTAWAAQSDERTKDIVEPIADAVNKVSSLRAVIGKYKTDENGTRRSFLIAQDVQAVLPEAVSAADDEQGTLSLRYTEIIPLLVAAIKEQQAIITQLQADVAALKGTP